MKKIAFILPAFLLFACTNTPPFEKESIATPVENQTEIKKTPVIADNTPMRIIPRVEIMNSKVDAKKNLFIIEDASLVCTSIIEKNYRRVNDMPLNMLDNEESEKIGELIENYTKKVPDNYIGVILGFVKVDYDNNGSEDIVLNQGVSFIKPIKNDETNYNHYDYQFLSAINGNRIVEFANGDETPYYYQDKNQTYQEIILVNEKNYLATFNKRNRITRVDEITTSKNGSVNHIICEFGAQK